jgi:3-oxoacyl-[acyl-carrier protein] reductase
MQQFFSLLKKSKSGSFINISSVSGQYGGPRTAHYAASKAGLISLTQVYARFCAKHQIRCNSVSPGLIASEMAKGALKSKKMKNVLSQILLKRMGTPEEVAHTCTFLSSDNASYITGQVINVNGGLYF